jgi:hypothetical protein
MNKTNSITSTNAVSNVADSFKDLGLEWLLDYFTILESIDYITFTINLLILIFGRQIINHLSVQTIGAAPPQLRLLRILNAALFLTYFFAVAFQFQLASNISHTGLLVLLTYLIWQLTHSIILKKIRSQAGGRGHFHLCGILHFEQPETYRTADPRGNLGPGVSQPVETRMAAPDHQLPRGAGCPDFHDEGLLAEGFHQRHHRH